MQHKAVVFGIILLSSLNLYSQKAELFGGYHFPSFVISEKPESSEVHASNGNGFSLGISFQDVMIQKTLFSLSFGTRHLPQIGSFLHLKIRSTKSTTLHYPCKALKLKSFL